MGDTGPHLETETAKVVIYESRRAGLPIAQLGVLVEVSSPSHHAVDDRHNAAVNFPIQGRRLLRLRDQMSESAERSRSMAASTQEVRSMRTQSRVPRLRAV